MMYYYSAASRTAGAQVGSLPYHKRTKRQVAEATAQKLGKAIAAQGRVQCCPAEAYCGEQLEVWTVLHKGDAALGQRVTRLQGGFFCDCPNLVERAMHCRHICAVVEHEAAAAQAEADTSRFESALHRILQPDAEVRKRSGPPRAMPQRPLAEGTRVVVRMESGESQVGVIVGNARETLDVKFGKDEPRTRVPMGSILQWIKTGKLGATRPASRGKTKQARSAEQAAGTPGGNERGDAGPKAVKWGFKLRDASVRNTCPYDAIFVPLMHVLKSHASLLVSVRNNLKRDRRMDALHDAYTAFWNADASVNEVNTAWPGGAARRDLASRINAAIELLPSGCDRLAWRT